MDSKTAVAAVACCFLLLRQCDSDPITGAKAAVGAGAVGVGIGGGVVGASALGAASRGISKGIEARARDRVARPRPQRPNGPARPYSPTTSMVLDGIEVGP